MRLDYQGCLDFEVRKVGDAEIRKQVLRYLGR